MILRSINPDILPHGPNPSLTESTSNEYIVVLTQKANDLRSYISFKYGEDFSSWSDESVILLGITMVPFEQRDGAGNRMSAEAVYNCALMALGAATGVGGMIREFVTAWSSGATTRTLLGFMGRIAGRYFGWWMAAEAVYSFGQCSGWW